MIFLSAIIPFSFSNTSLLFNFFNVPFSFSNASLLGFLISISKEEEEKRVGRIINGNSIPGLEGMITDSLKEDLELKWLTQGSNSMAAWEKMTGGLFATKLRKSFSKTLIRSSFSCSFSFSSLTWRSREA